MIMADISRLISNIMGAAKVATRLIPGTTDDAILAAGEKLVGLLDDLTGKAPDSRTQAEMQSDRRKLAAAVSAKAERTADRFDG
jgi:hypothetical protein